MLGARVTPSARKTRAAPPATPKLPPPVVSISETTAPATSALVLLSNTTPYGSTSTSACITVAPQPGIETVRRSFALTVSAPSPAVTAALRASRVGTLGSMWKMPLLMLVSVATKVSASPVSCDVIEIARVSRRSGSMLHCAASTATKNGWPALMTVARRVYAASLKRRIDGGTFGTARRTRLESVATGAARTPSMKKSCAALSIAPLAFAFSVTSRLRVNDWPATMLAAKPNATASTRLRSAGGVVV